MTNVFYEILQMSVTGSFVILFVCAARLLLKKAPKIYSYILWALVLFRLLCPMTITSSVSLVPKEMARVETVAEESLVNQNTSEGLGGDEILLNGPISVLPDSKFETEPIHISERPMQTLRTKEAVTPWEIADYIRLGCYIWIAGVVLMLGYGMFSLLRIYRRVQVCIHQHDRVFIAQDIDTPFTLGIISPKIYLPAGLLEREVGYIIAHEMHHIKRLDHVIKFAACVALCIHWFNPLVWMAFVLAGKDMEMSCDEAVMKEFTEDIRQEYSGSLLNLATGKKIIAMAPLSFGEGNIKERITNVMNYKKPVFGITILAVVVCLILSICLLTNPKEDSGQGNNTLSESEELSEPTEAPSPTPQPTATPSYHADMGGTGPIATPIAPVDKEISAFFADLTGDGVDERVVLSTEVYPGEEPEVITAEYLWGPYLSKVSVYEGLGGESYESEPIWYFGDISASRPGNYQLSLIEKEDKDYLLISSMHEQQGDANYDYRVISLSDSGEEILADEYSIFFNVADSIWDAPSDMTGIVTRKEVLPEFQERFEKWYDENGILLIATDVNMWDEDVDGVLFSTKETPVWYMEYYNRVFARTDYFDFMGKTQFQTKYFTFELPDAWVDKVHYKESEDGKFVQIYHTKTSEIERDFGLLGTIALMTQEEALNAMELVSAHYIGSSYVAEDGVTYMPMSIAVSDVQWVAETEAEYREMAAYFRNLRMANHVYVTESDGGDNVFLGLGLGYYAEKYPEFGLQGGIVADLGQKLLWPSGTAYRVEVFFESDGANHVLQIGGKDYSDIAAEIGYINFSSAWYTIVDLDVTDDSHEIMIFEDGPSADPNIYLLRLEDGKLRILGNLGTLGFESAFIIPGDGTITIIEQTWVPENNSVEKTYMEEDGALVEIPREEYVYLYPRFHEVIADLKVYKERNLDSEKLTLNAGEQICITKVYSSEEYAKRFYQIVTGKEEIYYLYSEGNLDAFLAGLSHAG